MYIYIPISWTYFVEARAWHMLERYRLSLHIRHTYTLCPSIMSYHQPCASFVRVLCSSQSILYATDHVPLIAHTHTTSQGCSGPRIQLVTVYMPYCILTTDSMSSSQEIHQAHDSYLFRRPLTIVVFGMDTSGTDQISHIRCLMVA